MAQSQYGGVVAIVFSTTRVILVWDPSHEQPRWKFPGGGIEKNETPEEAASRELKEETGIKMKAHAFSALLPAVDGKHILAARASEQRLKKRAERGIEGEIPCLFTWEEFEKLEDFLGPHKEILEAIRNRFKRAA